MITADPVLRAIDRHRNDKLSNVDALIVDAARASHCAILDSEDMRGGWRFGALQVVNRFA